MIKKYSLKVLQKAINHALALDPSMPEKIMALEGKVLKVIIAPLTVSFYIHFTAQQIELLPYYESEPDTIIQSSPLGLIRLSFLPASQARSLFNDQIKLLGDVELGHRIKKLFDELDIDWEGHLALFTGDVVAYQFGSLLRNGLRFKKQVTNTFSENFNDYVHEELRIFPPREEIEDFYHDIDALALDVERLAAQINQLKVSYESD